MSVAGWSSDTPDSARALADRMAPVRATGRAALTCARVGDRTRIVDLDERGGYRIKFPTSVSSVLEPVVINTGGGVAGGDKVTFDVTANAGAEVALSTATAERIYRSLGAPTEIDVRLRADAGASLSWLPQATILFSGSRLRRRFDVNVSGNARLLMAEATVFGRIASGETMGAGHYHDAWRVHREGRLYFAETTRLDGNLGEIMLRPAAMGTARSTGLLLYVGPDAEDLRDAVRTALTDAPALHGISAWNRMLIVRVLADGLTETHQALQRAVQALTPRHVPRAWAH